MRNIIVLGVIALLLFGLSAGVSLYLRQLQERDHPTKVEEGKAALAPAAAPSASAGPTRGPRPAYNAEAESAATLAAKMRDQEENFRKREQSLISRQKNLEIINQDIRAERAVIDDLRKQLDEEMKALSAKLDSTDRKISDLDQKGVEASKEFNRLKAKMSEFEGTERDRIRQVAGMYDTMAPESAAKILQQMEAAGKRGTAVKILSTMKERQAAKVLAELKDPSVAASLLEELKTLKRPTASAPK